MDYVNRRGNNHMDSGMKKTDLITVVVTNWNYGMFLRQAVNSILDQTVLPKEIIIADDGSTDNSYSIEEEYVKENSGMVRLLRRQDRAGLIINLNEAAKEVTTPWMCFLAADDLMVETYLEKVLKVIQRSDDKLAIVYSDMMRFGKWEGYWQVEDWNENALRQANYINGHAVMRKRAYEDAGGYKETPGFEDHQLWVDMLDTKKGYYGVRIPEALIYYRRHGYGHRTDKTDITTRA